METTVTGMFASPERARSVVQELEVAGFARDAIALITKDTPDRHHLVAEETADLARGIYLGGAVGLLGGAAGGLLLAALVPSFPLSMRAAVLLLGLLAAIAGAAVGVLVGSATGHQVRDEYEHVLEDGGVLVAVNTDRVHGSRVQELLRAAGASGVSTSVHWHAHAAASA